VQLLKIHINEDGSFKETEITVNCNHINEEIEKMIAMLRVLDMKLTGSKDGQTYILDASKILYIDTVDKKTFFYTESEVYETQLKLYELEEQLASNDFFRASKSCIINFNQIKSLKSDIGRILVTMNNGEKLFISRQYVATFKNKLGVK
jgi:DNA-binding LytR/AlgR family response regulator